MWCDKIASNLASFMTICLLLAVSCVHAHESGSGPMINTPTRLLWNYTAGPDAGITPITLATNGATAYFGIFLYCIAVDVATGKQKWMVTTGFSVLARPQVRVQRRLSCPYGRQAKGLPHVVVLRALLTQEAPSMSCVQRNIFLHPTIGAIISDVYTRTVLDHGDCCTTRVHFLLKVVCG